MKLRAYTREFKEEAIKLAISSGNVSHTAQEIGVPGPTLHSWVKKEALSTELPSESFSKNPSHKPSVKQLISENQSLRKQLARAEQEKAILKKATAYFAQDQL